MESQAFVPFGFRQMTQWMRGAVHVTLTLRETDGNSSRGTLFLSGERKLWVVSLRHKEGITCTGRLNHLEYEADGTGGDFEAQTPSLRCSSLSQFCTDVNQNERVSKCFPSSLLLLSRLSLWGWALK